MLVAPHDLELCNELTKMIIAQTNNANTVNNIILSNYSFSFLIISFYH